MKPLASVFSVILLVSVGLSEGTNTLGLKVTNGNITEPKGAPGGNNGLCDTDLDFPDCEVCCTLTDQSVACVKSASDLIASVTTLATGATDTLWQRGTPPPEIDLQSGNQLIITLAAAGTLVAEVSQQAETELAGCYCTPTSDCP